MMGKYQSSTFSSR